MKDKTKIFIDKVKAKDNPSHKDANGDWLYNYDNVIYVKSSLKVLITCKEHGDFEQTPNKHLYGRGCNICKGGVSSNKEDFIIKARIEHDNKYTYEKVEYKNSLIKVVISCHLHGYFEQTPSSHLLGAGCSGCNGGIKYTNEDFETKANIVHDGKYTYEKVDYKDSHTRVVISCPLHGDFEQSPTKHLTGRGCRGCGLISYIAKRTYTNGEFKTKASIRHNDKYTYEKVDYKNSYIPVIITCPEHGDFEQVPNYHLNGNGCSICASLNNGYTRTDFRNHCIKNNKGYGILYAIRCYKGDEVFYKIGITSRSIEARFNTNLKMPYDIEVLHRISNLPDTIYNLEVDMLRELSEYSYTPSISFKGETECFSNIEAINNYLRDSALF